MKVVLIVAIIITGALVIGWLRGGEGFHIVQVLPFLGGFRPGIFDIGAIVMLMIVAWRISRFRGED